MTIDLGDPTLFLRSDVVDDPTALYDTLRAEAPVWRMPGTNIFVVSSPALIRPSATAAAKSSASESAASPTRRPRVETERHFMNAAASERFDQLLAAFATRCR